VDLECKGGETEATPNLERMYTGLAQKSWEVTKEQKCRFRWSTSIAAGKAKLEDGGTDKKRE